MRQALAAGVFALLLVTSIGVARADDPAVNPSNTEATISQTSVQSPDVEAWTSHIVVVGREHRNRSAEMKSLAGGILSRTSKIARRLTSSALRFLGTPYVFGGTSSSGFDCSGYVQHVFAMLGMSVPRTADAQYDAGHRIAGNMKAGDLVFFHTYEPGVSHVGIYIGNGNFVHASSSHGVMVSSLGDSYWSSRYVGAKRLIASR
ncbi:MAG: NlpC/P60 family protein [Candidatus Eremiobacteraeota bacterium]|nr:NlpC/P60 family protein [Candidatus Eremiobacteraeota bacterium]